MKITQEEDYNSAGYKLERIEEVQALEPKDKRTKAHKEWESEISKLYLDYNQTVNFKAFDTKKES